MTSFWLETHSQDDDLEECRFPTREQAEEVAIAAEYGGDGYMVPVVMESTDPPNITAEDYLAAAWPDYPGPVPAGVDPTDWFAGCDDDSPTASDQTIPGYPGPCPDGMDWSEWLVRNNVD